jgi:hypothetical protein
MTERPETDLSDPRLIPAGPIRPDTAWRRENRRGNQLREDVRHSKLWREFEDARLHGTDEEYGRALRAFRAYLGADFEENQRLPAAENRDRAQRRGDGEDAE